MFLKGWVQVNDAIVQNGPVIVFNKFMEDHAFGHVLKEGMIFLLTLLKGDLSILALSNIDQHQTTNLRTTPVLDEAATRQG